MMPRPARTLMDSFPSLPRVIRRRRPIAFGMPQRPNPPPSTDPHAHSHAPAPPQAGPRSQGARCSNRTTPAPGGQRAVLRNLSQSTPPSPCSCSSDPAAAACGGGHCSRRPRCCWRRWRRRQQPRWRRPSSSLRLLRAAQVRWRGRAPRRSPRAAAVPGARCARRCLRRSAGGSRTGALWCLYVCACG